MATLNQLWLTYELFCTWSNVEITRIRHPLFIILFILLSCIFSCRCLDILELSEHEDLRKFHYHTLKLYCALCALGNTRVAHALCSHLDQSQLLYTIDNQYLSGMLREGFYNVLMRSVALPVNWFQCCITTKPYTTCLCYGGVVLGKIVVNALVGDTKWMFSGVLLIFYKLNVHAWKLGGLPYFTHQKIWLSVIELLHYQLPLHLLLK